MKNPALLALLGAVVLFASAESALAAPAITLTDANDASNPVTYSAGPFVVPTAQTMGCTRPEICDDTALTIAVLPATTKTKRVVARFDWPAPVQADFDFFITQDGNTVATSASSTDPEIARFDAVSGVYTIHTEPYQPFGNSFSAKIYLEDQPKPGVTKAGPVAGFQIFVPPDTVGARGGEPSIGANWKTGSAVVGNFKAAIFINFDDSVKPATATWANRPPRTNITSFDPILFTDRETGFTVVSQLVSDVVEFSMGCSLSSITMDDGITWIPAEGCGPPAGADHQGIGGGPYHAPLAPLPPVNANAVYYCAQAVGALIGDATCSRSDDGGLTYGPGILVYTSECGGLHGHPRVAPDGTVYLPNARCAGADDLNQGVVVSMDNGLTWSIRVVPGTFGGAINDPSVATGLTDTGKPAGQASNTVYLGMCDVSGRAKVAVSHDQGATWGDLADVGQGADIKNCVFPEMIAGDDNRASMFFLGTSTPGAYQSADFTGEWHGYIATTYDGGKTWGLTDATPDDPVQIGCVWQGGGGNPCRNMLDFNDISIDKQGRPVFVFTDGCVPGSLCFSGASPDVSRSAVNTVGRQESCLTLFSEFDTTVGSSKCAKPAKPMKPQQRSEEKVVVAEKQGSGLLLGALGLYLLAPLFGLGLTRLGRFCGSKP